MKFLDLSTLKIIGQRKNKEEVRYICPFCKERKGTPDIKGHFYVNLKEGLFHCFRCDASIKTTGYFLESHTFKRPTKKPLDTIKILKRPRWYSSLTESKKGFFPYYNRYAKSRGVTKEDIERYDIGFTTDLEDPLFGRLIFCHFDRLAILDFLQGRWVLEDIPTSYKYLSSGDKPLFKSFEGKVKCGLIVEGIFDLIRASKFIPTAALLGHSISAKQKKEIGESFSEKVILALDADAVEEIIPCMKMFIEDIEVQPVFLPKKDLSEMENGEVEKFIKKFL